MEIAGFGGPVGESVSRLDDERLCGEVILDAVATLDVRSEEGVDLEELEALASPGPVHDIGVGHLDGLVQTYVDRRIVITGEVVIDRQTGVVESLQMSAVELPRAPLHERQLTLDFPFDGFAA